MPQTDLQALLAEIDRLDQEATRSPWGVIKHDYYEVGPLENDEGETVMSYDVAALTDQPDAEFIALAREALPTLAKLARNLLEIRNNAQRQADDINGGDALDLTKLSILTEVSRSINRAIEDALGVDHE